MLCEQIQMFATTQTNGNLRRLAEGIRGPKPAPKEERRDPGEVGRGKRGWIPGRGESMAKARAGKRSRQIMEESGDRGRRCRQALKVVGPECHGLGCSPKGRGSS